MLWQLFDKRRPSDFLPAVRLPAGHPPLTSLRSFAPPYALRRGRTHCRHCGKTGCGQMPTATSFRKFPPSRSVRGARGDAPKRFCKYLQNRVRIVARVSVYW